MKKEVFISLLLAVFVVVLISCASSRNNTPSRIGILPLTDYKVAATQLTADTVYRVVRNNEEFMASFASSISNGRKPDFNGQMVVAILVKDANTTGLRFDKAEVVGNTINVYAQSCSSANEEGCMKGNVVMATIPRAGNANRVAFYINGNSRFVSGL